jgi:predicted small lipoprotein YifL
MVPRIRIHTMVCLLTFSSLAACGSSGPAGFADGSGTPPGSSSSGAGTGSGGPQGGSDSGAPGSFGDAATPSGDGAAGRCASGAGQFIYVISDANDLYTFDPTKFPSASAFTLVGPVTCNTSGVNSMAVDRDAVAWVNFNDGSIARVTTTAPVTCTPTSFVSKQAGFTNALGMGFSVDSPGSDSETLFVSDNAGPGGTCTKATPGPGCTGKGLGEIDLASMTLTPLGGYTGTAAGYNAELTGTGDAKLYGFFTTSPGAYGPIDKSTGQTTSPAPTAVSAVNASTGGYAFSFWGGDFYFYTAPTDTTIVTHLTTATGATTVSPKLGFTIVGAGVSTCAPTTPPQ